MNRRAKHPLLAGAMASALFLGTAHAPADSLVTTDGDMMIGTVTKTATGYTIQTADGPVDLPAGKVKRILYDHPPAAPAKALAPGTADDSSTGGAMDPKKLKMLASLLEQGQSALAATEYADARDSFKDAMTLDSKNAAAGRGLGFAYIALGNPGKALAPLEIAALGSPLDRSLVLALSSALVADHNPMRAVKFLKPYLEAHSSPVDETMLNALGIALSQSSSSASKSELFKSSVALYLKLNTALEAGHPGKRRWGMEWEDSADVEEKATARKQVQDKVDAAWTRLETANENVTVAQAALKQATNTLGRRQDGKIRNAQQKLDQADKDQATAQTGYDTENTELAAAPAQSFPDRIAVANSDLSTFSPADASGGTDAKVVVAAGPVAPAAPSRTAKPTEKPKTDTDTDTDATATAPAAAPAPKAPRHVTRYAVAFAIAPDVLVTAWSALDGATTISVQTSDGKSMPATILQTHQGDGLALLKVKGADFPSLVIAGSMGTGAVSCMGFPEVDFFNPVPRSMDVSAGPVTDAWTVRFDTPPRLPGGPLIQNGAVVGVELGDRDSDPQSIPAATLKALQSIAGDSAQGGALTDPKPAVLQVTAEK